MSTYLVAFHVSDFPYKEKVTENGFSHRIFAQPRQIEKTNYSLIESVNILKSLSDYLQVNYSLPKMDQVALPIFLEIGLCGQFNQIQLNLLKSFENRNGKLGLSHIQRTIFAA